jgi:hypothetical protein
MGCHTITLYDLRVYCVLLQISLMKFDVWVYYYLLTGASRPAERAELEFVNISVYIL